MSGVAFPRDLSQSLTSGYNPKEVEKDWTAWWEAKQFFTHDAHSVDHVVPSQKFIMVIPPPNVTGTLHLGHTLTNAIEDCLARWNRMLGKVTLWVPGVDHAGIATQSIVERHILRTEGKTRHDLGREEFLKCTYAWKEKYGNKICNQLRRLGVSVDWSREAFTMSPMFSRAVQEAFIRLYKAKLIYRDIRLVSWCSYLKTALSDIEVETKEISQPERIRIPGYDKTVEVGVMWYFNYQINDEENKVIPVATTRLETMLGDVAVAVNPEDSRYQVFIGKTVRHPFFPDRHIPIIADTYVDPNFGTGAVKITPAHDRNDYVIAQTHGLPMIGIFTENGFINELGGDFCGMHRFDCRLELQRRLEDLGLFIEKKPITTPMSLPICSRSHDIVEYLLMPQWWMNCKDLAKRAVDAVESGELQIFPDYYKPQWFHWLNNIRDWCISRQLWWGHRIPAYRVTNHEAPGTEEIWIVAHDDQEARERAREQLNHDRFTLTQDSDVLDTWFSSALFPFAVFGWPENTKDLLNFFPTSLLETGHDILFFWVARMVIMSLFLLNRLPFHHIFLHAMVRDSHGKKMSKSLGNVLDPIDVIEGITLQSMTEALKDKCLPDKEYARAMEAQKKDFPKGIPECGTDALRYGLLAYTNQGRSINLDVNRIVGYRFFCNKLWNATRFALTYLSDFDIAESLKTQVNPTVNLKWPEQWILHRLSRCCDETNMALQHYEFSKAVNSTYAFWLYDLCDIYLEVIKPRINKISPQFNQETRTILRVLFLCFDRGLRLLHPMLPYVTEELYQRLWSSQQDFLRSESICIAPFPLRVLSWEDSHLDEEMESLMLVVRKFRSLLAELQLGTKDHKDLEGYVCLVSFINEHNANYTTSKTVDFFEKNQEYIASLVKLTKIHITHRSPTEQSKNSSFPHGCISTVVTDRIQIAIDSKSVVDLKKVYTMLEKKRSLTKKSFDAYMKKTELPHYLEKVPQEIRIQNEEKIKQLRQEIESVEDIQASLMSLL